MKEILEPLKEFANYQNEFDSLVKNTFDGLVKTSQIDVSENRRTVERYNHADIELKQEKKKLNRMRGWKSFLIFLCVASAVGIVVGGLMLYGAVSTGSSMLSGVLTIVISSLIMVTMILLITLVVGKKIKVLRDSVKSLKQNADSILNQALEQMAPLNNIIDCGVAKDLVNQLDTVIHIDRVYTVMHEVFLHNNYKFPYFSNEDNSTTNMVVGSINKNPFIITRELSVEIGRKTYQGSLVVTWTETRYSKGKSTTVHHSQTLVAEIDAPCPFYENETFLVYGNDSAPDLNFTRRPQALNKDDKQVERMVKKGEKKLEKIAEDDRKHGDGSFIAMSDTEFDVLFGAFDRDNENQFRLLFTPLAQRNMIDFIKDSPYSDDFYFIKQGKLNTIYAHHSDGWIMPVGARVSSHSVDIAEEEFIKYNSEYFKNLYFMITPLLNIPIYQQHKPFEMEDVDLTNQTNIAGREVEMIANIFPDYFVCAPNTATDSIRKIKYKPSTELVDYVTIYAYSYSAIRRLEYIPKMAGNGRTYGVPVYWDEYIPISKATEALVFDVEGLSADKRAELLDLLFKYDCSLEMPNASHRAVAEYNGVMMIIPKQGVIEELIPQINKILKTKNIKPIKNIKDLYEAADNFLN